MDEDYLKRAELIRRRLNERSRKNREDETDDDAKNASHKPGSLTQKLKPILGKIERLNRESRRISREQQ
ncbi:MAG: hypothetical protein ABIH86_04715 [Planctomycetota bacterium]